MHKSLKKDSRPAAGRGFARILSVSIAASACSCAATELPKPEEPSRLDRQELIEMTRSKKVAIFGEIHPVLADNKQFISLIPDLARAGFTHLGIELGSQFAGIIEAYRKAPSIELRNVLKAHLDYYARWNNITPNFSESMVSIIDAAHKKGMAVVCIDDPSSADRDKHMKEVIDGIIAKGGKIIVFVGSWHARLEAASTDATVPLGKHLSETYRSDSSSIGLANCQPGSSIPFCYGNRDISRFPQGSPSYFSEYAYPLDNLRITGKEGSPSGVSSLPDRASANFIPGNSTSFIHGEYNVPFALYNRSSGIYLGIGSFVELHSADGAFVQPSSLAIRRGSGIQAGGLLSLYGELFHDSLELILRASPGWGRTDWDLTFIDTDSTVISGTHRVTHSSIPVSAELRFPVVLNPFARATNSIFRLDSLGYGFYTEPSEFFAWSTLSLNTRPSLLRLFLTPYITRFRDDLRFGADLKPVDIQFMDWSTHLGGNWTYSPDKKTHSYSVYLGSVQMADFSLFNPSESTKTYLRLGYGRWSGGEQMDRAPNHLFLMLNMSERF